MTILDDILRRTRDDVRDRCARAPLAELRARCRDGTPTRGFRLGLTREPSDSGRRRGAVRVVAEIKKASPSRGIIRPDFDAVSLARSYAAAGANAISVLTDAPFFQGSLAHLAAVRRAVELPLLRKDFHVDPYQLWEARAAGADAVLLIVAALSASQLQDLLGLSHDLGMSALTEVHTREELDAALACGAELIGVNNRDLRTFEVSLETTFCLLPAVPSRSTLVSESGISDPDQVRRLEAAGVDGILVGEGLLRHADPGQALRRLTGEA
ncbi:MAG: indole-3-glycerol phosphate synthase TrpC [Zetaproteobacteria bacterium]|nr:MAG: indole-3-glycerol phosphate synthase TrpC [Zetaproteobacteria bacterium]